MHILVQKMHSTPFTTKPVIMENYFLIILLKLILLLLTLDSRKNEKNFSALCQK